MSPDEAGTTRSLAWARRHLTTRQLMADAELRGKLAAELHRKRTSCDVRTLAVEYNLALDTVSKLISEHQAQTPVPASMQQPVPVDPAERRELALRLKRAGHRARKVATEAGISARDAAELLREFDAELRARHLAPCSVGELAAEYGVTETVMTRWLRSAGMGTPNGGEHAPDRQPRPDLPGPNESDPAPTSGHAHRVIAHVAHELRCSRLTAKLTVDTVSARLNASPGTVRSWEGATRAMSLQRFVMYCEAVGDNPAEVFARAYTATLRGPGEAPVTVDLAKLAATTRPELQGLRRFAKARIATSPLSGKPFVLTEQTQNVLADLIDVDVGTLLTLIADA